jgi:hypothetical protein
MAQSNSPVEPRRTESLMFTRRHFLRVGTVAVAAPFACAAASPRRPRAESVILLFMDGGPSHIDLFDLKPNAPAEVRGPFHAISTSVPGTRVCEHLPRVAERMHRILQIRSVRHTDGIHDPAVYLTLTGRRHPTPLGGLRVSPDDAPHMGSLFAALDRSRAPVPKVIELPETMKMEARTLPGQNGGFLGAAADPFRIAVTPDARVVPPAITLPPEVDAERLLLRGNLRTSLDHRLAELERSSKFDAARQQAVHLLASPQLRDAFDLSKEPDRLRDTYGRHRHGQSVCSRGGSSKWGRSSSPSTGGASNRTGPTA